MWRGAADFSSALVTLFLGAGSGGELVARLRSARAGDGGRCRQGDGSYREWSRVTVVALFKGMDS